DRKSSLLKITKRARNRTRQYLGTRTSRPHSVRSTLCFPYLYKRSFALRAHCGRDVRAPGFASNLFYSVIDLRPLQFAAVINVNRLPFGEDIQDLCACFAMTIARGFSAAEWQMNFSANR